MNIFIEKEIQGYINSIGYLEKSGVYFREPDCFDTLKEIAKLLNQDDIKCTARRQCLVRNIVKNDLVPILKTKDIDSNLFNLTQRITMILCQPLRSVLRENSLEENERWLIFYEMESNLIDSLPAFANPEIFRIFEEKMSSYFNLPWEERVDAEKIVVERILVLVRYIFTIGMDGRKINAIPKVDMVVREKVINSFLMSGLSDLFLSLAINPMEKELSFEILTVFAQILRNYEPAKIAVGSYKKELNLEGKLKEEKEEKNIIEAMRIEDMMKRRVNQRSFLSSSYVVNGIKALNPENNFIVSGSQLPGSINPNPIERLSNRKRPKRTAQNRRIENLDENNSLKLAVEETNPITLENLKSFCSKILEQGRYNKMMKITLELAFTSSRSSKDDKLNEVYFLMLATFMMEFSRSRKGSCKEVESTFSLFFYHKLLDYIVTSFDLMKSNRTNLKTYVLRAQHAVSVYKEIMKTLSYIMESTFPDDKKQFHDFCLQIFDSEDYRELPYTIFSRLSPSGSTKKMLRDLIIGVHYYVHIMEKVVEQGQLLKVKKQKRVRKEKKKQDKEKQKYLKSLSKAMNLKEPLEDTWEAILSKLSDVVAGVIPKNEDISPFDALLDLDPEQYQLYAVLKVQLALRRRNICDAFGIYRGAREIWPETDVFGNDKMSHEEELNSLKEIFFKDLQIVFNEYQKICKKVYGNTRSVDDDVAPSDDEELDVINNKENDGASECDEVSELYEEETETTFVIEDVPFDYKDFVRSCFGRPEVVQWYILLLRDFELNQPDVNKAIIKNFHRIVFQLDSAATLYQASLFKVFRNIASHVMKYPAESRKCHKYYFLYEFGYYLLDKFFMRYKESGSTIICELLFPKSIREALDIQMGYDA